MTWSVLTINLGAGRELLSTMERAQSLAYAAYLRSSSEALPRLGIFTRTVGDRITFYFTPDSAKLLGTAIDILGALPCDPPTRSHPPDAHPLNELLLVAGHSSIWDMVD